MQIECLLDEASELISNFVRENGIRILNVAGPRASEWAEGYDYAFKVARSFPFGCRDVSSRANREGPRERPL